MTLKKYHHIIWDWNGTLLNDADFCVNILNRLLAKRQLPLITVEMYREVFVFPVRAYYQLIGFDFHRESFEDVGHEFIAAYEAGRHDCALYPDTRLVLEHVITSGRSQSLLSAYAQDMLSSIVHRLELEHFFEHLIGSDNIYAHGKVAQGQRLLAALSHAPETILLVGDTQHDAEVAKAMGIACILISHGHQTKARLQQIGAPVVDSMRELLALI